MSLDHLAALGRVRNTGAIAAREAEVLAAAKNRSAEDFARWLRALDDTIDMAKGIDLDAVPVVLSGDGRVLDIGRSNRIATDAQWFALLAQDGGCVLAECNAPAAWCEAHHLHQWENGGRSDLANLCLLCPKHHHALHAQGWTARRDGLHLHIEDTNGSPIPTRSRKGPTPPRAGPP